MAWSEHQTGGKLRDVERSDLGVGVARRQGGPLWGMDPPRSWKHLDAVPELTPRACVDFTFCR